MVLFCNWLIKGPLYNFTHIKISAPFVRSTWKRLWSVLCGSLGSPRLERNNTKWCLFCFVFLTEHLCNKLGVWKHGSGRISPATDLHHGKCRIRFDPIFRTTLNYWSRSEKCSFILSFILTELKHNSNPHIWRAGIRFCILLEWLLINTRNWHFSC